MLRVTAAGSTTRQISAAARQTTAAPGDPTTQTTPSTEAIDERRVACRARTARGRVRAVAPGEPAAKAPAPNILNSA